MGYSAEADNVKTPKSPGIWATTPHFHYRYERVPLRVCELSPAASVTFPGDPRRPEGAALEEQFCLA